MLLLSKEDISRVVTMRDMIEACKTAYKMVADGTIDNPLRTVIRGKDNGTFLFMPSYAPDLDTAALKVVNIFPHNTERGLFTSPAQVMLIDGSTGYITALLDGTFVTQLRTGASTGVAFDLLAKENCRKGALIGTGGQAAAQLEAMICARHPEEVAIYSRNQDKCLRFTQLMQAKLADYGVRFYAASGSDDAIDDADLIIAATTSSEPVFDGTKVKPGATVSGVGTYEPHKHELDPALLTRASGIICDSVDAVLAESGDLLIPINDGTLTVDAVRGSIGDVINGTIPGRMNDEEIIVYETVGVAAQDLVSARMIYDKALAAGIGLTWG